MEQVKAHMEIINFIAGGTTPASVIAFEPSAETKQRVSDLIYREKTTGLLAAEKAELDDYLTLEHIMRMAKIRARQILRQAESKEE